MTTKNEGKALAAAVEAVEEAEKPVSDKVTLSSGVVLRMKPVPPFLIRNAAANLKRPRPPIVHIDEKGRDEENPNDPGYKEELEQFELQSTEAGLNVVLLVGTELVSVPKGFPRPEDDSWLETLDVLGVEVNRDNKKARYLAWLRYCAVESADDIESLTRMVAGGVGLTDKEVTQAADSFRNREARRANKRVSAKASRDGDNV